MKRAVLAIIMALAAGCIFAAAPTVTGIAPSSGPDSGGTAVTITGTNLTGATQVNYGSITIYAITFVNDNTIIFTTLHFNGTVDITVTTPGGTSAITTADQFTFLPPTATITPTFSSTPTYTCTDTVTPTSTVTDTPAQSQTNSPTVTVTTTPSFSPTSTSTGTITQTPTASPTFTHTATITVTCTVTPTITITDTPLPTPTIPADMFVTLKDAVYPNPAKISDTVYVLLNGNGKAEAIIYSIDGREVKRLTLRSASDPTGRYNVDTSDLAPGVYFYRIIYSHNGFEDKSKVRKMVLTR